MIKEKVLDRIEQSFLFMKTNFILLFSPIAIFYLLIYYIFENTLLYIIEFFNIDIIYSYENFYIIIGICILIFLYLTLEIGIIIGLYKTIIDLYNNKKTNLKLNYKYGFLNIFNLFKTYFHIFMYVYFIPSLIFIIFGFFFIYLQYTSSIDFSYKSDNFGLIILFLFVFLLFTGIFSIYRGNKSIFAIINAINKNEYSKENFEYSIKLTHNSWWRIFGNFFVVGMIIYLLLSIINNFFNFNSLMDTLGNSFKEGNSLDNLDLKKIMQEYRYNRVLNIGIIQDFISRIMLSIQILFMSIFTYFFYIRIDIEKNNLENKNII